MSNTSATGGYLTPEVASPPLEGDSLDAQFQQAVAGITGIAGQYVRPRWQATSPKQPPSSVDWCSIGVTSITPDDGAYVVHVGLGDGTDKYIRHEKIELACSFYGANSQQFAAMLRDGIAIPQNMEALQAADIYFVECGVIYSMPELINQQWVKRCDMGITFMRQVHRTYGIQNILSADTILVSDDIGIITH